MSRNQGVPIIQHTKMKRPPRILKKKKLKKQQSLKSEEQITTKKKKQKKTYFRIKSAGNTRTSDKMSYK
jgi:hypothetical protein